MKKFLVLLLFLLFVNSSAWSAFDVGKKFTVGDDGFAVLSDTALAWGEVRIVQETFRLGVVAPVFETGFRGDANFSVLNFINTQADEVQFTIQFPHDWDLGVVFPHVHASPWIASAGDKAVRFILQYYWADDGATFPASPSNYTMTATWTGDAQWKHLYVFNATGITPSGITKPSSIMVCRLWRDNTVGNNLAGKVTVFEFDIHYKINTFGSKQERSKF